MQFFNIRFLFFYFDLIFLELVFKIHSFSVLVRFSLADESSLNGTSGFVLLLFINFSGVNFEAGNETREKIWE